MALNPADVAEFSRLLDAGLALPADERDAWLAALPEPEQRLAALLREMLAAEQAGLQTDQWLRFPSVAPASETVAQAGEQVGPYQLLREIGHGGMGSVWLAERIDGGLRRQVALKLPRLVWGVGLAERMARERDIGALLEHPAIARLYDAGVDQRGRPFLAFEYIDGQPIDAWCEARALDVRARLRLFVQVARAVAYAHGQLVVHRDLKPSNVLVTSDGQIHLLDFGIAKLLHEAEPGDLGLTQEQGRVLTPLYASPEQIAGEAITVTSDVYSLGVLLFELLTGTLPHSTRRSTLGAVEDAILHDDAPAASSRAKDGTTVRALRGEVDSILAKAIQREPAKRYRTADALADDIERYLCGQTVTARPDSMGYRLRKAVVRNRAVVAATAAVAIALLSGGAVAVVQAQRATRAAERQRLVVEFVADVFRVNYRQGIDRGAANQVTGERLLAEGAALIAQRFPGDPGIQADLYGVIGDLFLEMSASEQAVDYATRQVEALHLMRVDGATQAAALNRLAQALIGQGRFADAESRARRAAELARGDETLEIDAWSTLAKALMYMANYPLSEQALARVDDLTRALGRETVAEAWSYAIRGSILGGRNRYPESGAQFDRGIAMALRVEGETSQAAAGMRLLRAVMMFNHGEGAAARAMWEAGTEALRRRGGAAVVKAEVYTAMLWRLLVENELATYPEALREIDRALAYLAAQPFVPDSIRKRIEHERATVLVRSGQIHEGWRQMVAAETVIDVSDSPFWKFSVAGRLALAAAAAGDYERAAAWSRKTTQLRAAVGESSHPYAVYDYVRTARFQSEQGRYEEALATLRSAPKLDELATGGPVAAAARTAVLWSTARVLADRGDYIGAWKLVGDQDPVRFGQWGKDDPRATLAELQCALGRAAQGRASFDLLIAEMRPTQHEQSAELAWLRAQAGRCALALREREVAQALAAQARAAFIAQPDVSPYFKVPLAKLEAALGTRTVGLH